MKLLSILLAFFYFLGNYGGYIALFPSEKADPVEIFPYKVSSLPPADQEKLHAGIPIETEQELVHILEDYLS